MFHQLVTRQGMDLVLDWKRLGEMLDIEQAHTQPRAGSHPHEVRQWLLAYSFFPTKWLNQIFSVGGMKWNGDLLHLLAYQEVDITRDEVYRSAVKLLSSGDDMVQMLYEDEHCLVVYKAAGMPVHGSVKGQQNTLDVAVAAYMLNKQDPILVRHIHRLDDETSGPVLYAKHQLAQLKLDEQMRNNTVDRQYIAIVHGKLSQDEGTVNAPIGKDRREPKRRVVTASGDSALTHYHIVAKYEHYTEVALKLETGRTHQIRVHMKHLGHPLVGDKLYGGDTKWLNHQALHGASLTFSHPLSSQQVYVQAMVPAWYAEIKQHITKR